MTTKDFKISTTTVWVLVIGNLLLTIGGAIAKLQGWPYGHVLLSLGLVFFFSSWLFVFSDLIRNKIYNKTFWLFIMVLLPAITPFVYLVQRNRLLRMGHRFS